MRKTISFWEMLKSCEVKIIIPRIQRDYAQGRTGKELLRNRFLTGLRKSLDEKKELLLDFIYGSKEDNGCYYPLDGQQRLTTLWLLHWYVAYNAGLLKENCCHLSKFSYETRRSSTDFCQFLCNIEADVIQQKKIREYITSQTKFLAKWELDPTVDAMLNTICGTDVKDQYNKDIVDGLIELFQDVDTIKFSEYWEILTGPQCPIRFYNLDMRGENLPLADDLYVKMNARGKQLSDWENFKADLLDFVENKDELGSEIDGCWTDLFWLNHNGGKIDALLFSFVNRYIFNELLCSDISQSELISASLYKLYGKESNDVSLRYIDFSCYKSGKCAEITKNACKKLIKLMCNLYKFVMTHDDLIDISHSKVERLQYLRKLVQSGWSDKDNFEFMPVYTNEGISKILSPQRLVFLAICRYFEKVETFNEEKFQDWIRFAWNISEYIRVDAMSNAYILIDAKSEFCEDILVHLKDDSVVANSFASEQLKEEIEKARYILSNTDKKDTILQVEKFKDLHGHIGFLFRNEKNDLYWEGFDNKFEYLKKLFDSDIDIDITLKEANLLKIFLSYCTNIEQIESWTNNYSYIYDYSWESWKANFSNPKYVFPTHMFLMKNKMRDENEAINCFNSKGNYLNIYKFMLRTNLLDNVAKKLKSGKQRPYLRKYGEYLCLYPSAEGINMEREDRDRLLQLLNNKGTIKLNDDDIFSDPQGERLFLKGWDISFTYNEVNFYWNWKNILYINDLKYKEIKKDISEDEFIELLNSAVNDK